MLMKNIILITYCNPYEWLFSSCKEIMLQYGGNYTYILNLVLDSFIELACPSTFLGVVCLCALV